jgi:hypothetical protein
LSIAQRQALNALHPSSSNLPECFIINWPKWVRLIDMFLQFCHQIKAAQISPVFHGLWVGVPIWDIYVGRLVDTCEISTAVLLKVAFSKLVNIL